MDWARDLPTWPLAELSRRIAHGPHHWHVQEAGTGETLLLLHGAGASTHSWRGVIPLLAARFHVVALDLPGHAFTRAGGHRRLGLTAMTEDVAALCKAQSWAPRALIGHSAGAALSVSLSDRLDPRPRVIGINPALDRFPGLAGWLFPVLAKMLAVNPLTAALFTLGGDPVGRARRLIASTGSTLDAAGYQLYARLISDRAHVDGTLRMMAQWDIGALIARLPRIATECRFLTGARDGTVPPLVAERAAAALPRASVVMLPGLGHLAQEEAPDRVAAELLRALDDRPERRGAIPDI